LFGGILLSIPAKIGIPLLLKEAARYLPYGKGSGWPLSCFIKKVKNSKTSFFLSN